MVRARCNASDSRFLLYLRSFEKIFDRRASPHEVSFRLQNSTIRERVDPKGEEGGGGRRIPATQSRTQVRTRLWTAARRPARKSARGSAEPDAGPHATTQARTQAWTGPWRLYGAARAGEAFPLPGCGS